MAWLYVPSMDSPSAPDTEGLSLDSGLRSPTIELWATSSGKPRQRRPSWRGWKNRPWIRLLSGTMSPPSMVRRGAERFLLSLRASLASPSQPPENASTSTITAGSGQTSLESFATYHRASSSWRTSQTSLFEDSPTYLDRWPYAGSMRNGVASERETLERRTQGNASGSWPTPNTRDSASSGRHSTTTGVMHPGTSLTDAIRQTPKAWASPQAADGGRGTSGKGFLANREGSENLGDQVNWPTPTCRDLKTEGKRAADNFPTPKAQQSGSSQNGINGLGGEFERPSANTPSLETIGRRWDQASGRPDSVPQTGKMSPMVINPAFVEWLMGLPVGWTVISPVPSDSASLGTAWFRWLRRTHSALLRLAR